MSSGTAVLVATGGKLFSPREGKRRVVGREGGVGGGNLSRDDDDLNNDGESGIGGGGSRWTVGIGRRQVVHSQVLDRPPPTEDDQCWSWWGGENNNPTTPHPDPCPNCKVLTVVGSNGSASSGGSQCAPVVGRVGSESSDFVELVLVRECRGGIGGAINVGGGVGREIHDSSPPRTLQSGSNMSTEISYFQDVSVHK